MNIVWFSEIRWDYLKTRKQHLLSQFPEGDKILFIQPFNLTKTEKSKFIPSNISCITVPIFRRGNRLSNIFSKYLLFRWIIYKITKFYTKMIIKKYYGNSDIVICISNIFYIPIIEKLNSRIFWDFNDDPAQFSPIPIWIEQKYIKLLSDPKTTIVSSSIGLEGMISKRFKKYPITIPNGVELSKFENYKRKNISKKKIILGYIGVISNWFFDFELIHNISKHFPETEIWIYGPQDKKAHLSIKKISKLSNVKIFPPLDYDDLPSTINLFSIGIIPLKSIDMVWRLASGKLLQFLASGIPVVSVYMEQYIKLKNLKLCKTHNEFIEGLNYFLKNSNSIFNENDLSKYDWSLLANRYRKLLYK
ncbi:MAG: hypothetical protein H8E60_00030 [Candidatus Marinimicrobia bacterium]|nr:hypothetical protein [Candidatus Neomarinimicrobiota bacterium]